MMSGYRYAILYHNYYVLEGVDDMRRRIAQLGRDDLLLLCSLPEKFAGEALLQTDHEKFLLTANIGKDIGAKLLLMELLLHISPDTEYAILLHDKRSYQKGSGKFERDALFDVITPAKFEQIAAAFLADGNMGIACAKGYSKTEYDGKGGYATTNDLLLPVLQRRYGLALTRYQFVAGTMFWIRVSILRDFFGRHAALGIRSELERGNVLDHEKGSWTHSWERGLSWLALSSGYSIKEF